jgi:hypothetical protein
MDPRTRWALGYVGLTVVLLVVAETSAAPAAAALAVLISGSATWLMLPKSLRNLGLIQ